MCGVSWRGVRWEAENEAVAASSRRPDTEIRGMRESVMRLGESEDEDVATAEMSMRWKGVVVMEASWKREGAVEGRHGSWHPQLAAGRNEPHRRSFLSRRPFRDSPHF